MLYGVPVAPGLDSPLDTLPRITAADVRRLHKLGLRNVRELLLHLPFGWEAYGEPVALADVVPGSQATVLVKIERVAAKRTRRRRMQLTEALVSDDSGRRLAVVWFNQPYLARQLHAGDRLALAGQVPPSPLAPAPAAQDPPPRPA